MKTMRVISLIILGITTIISADLLMNLLGNLLPVINDGVGLHTVIFPGKLFFGDNLWSFEKFYSAFVASTWITLVVFVENIVLAIISIVKK